MAKIPGGLRAHGYGRTDEALSRIETAKSAILRDLNSGKLGKLRKSIDRAYVIRRAGLNQYFLKGPRHSGDTKADVQSFVERINELLLEREPDPQVTIDQLRARVTEWEAKYQRVSDNMNKWAGKLRESRKEVRDLKRQLQLLAENAEIRVLPVISPNPRK